MFDQIKRLFKHSFVYAIGSLAQTAVGFILIPLYTRHLNPTEYGQLEILNTIIQILTVLLSFGFISALLKVYERDAKNEEEQRMASGTMFIFIVPVATFLSLVLYLCGPWIANTFLGGTNNSHLIDLVLVTNLLTVFTALAFSILRAKEKSVKYVVLSLLRFVLLLVLNIYTVVILHWGVGGIWLGNLIAQIALTVAFIPTIFKNSKFLFNKLLFKKLMVFGLAIIPASLAMWVIDLSDRYFLKFFVDMHEVGLYSLGYKIGTVITIILTTPLQLAWPTVSFSVSKRVDAKEIYAKVLTYFTLIGATLALLMSLFAPLIVKIFAGHEFYEAYKIVPWIAFAYVLYGVHFVVTVGVHLVEKSKYYPLFIIFPALANVGLNFYFVPKFGMMGAAWTTMIAFALMVILTYLVSNRLYPVKYEWKRLGKIVLAVGLTLLLSRFVDFWALILFVVLIWIFKFFDRQEIDKLKNLGKVWQRF